MEWLNKMPRWLIAFSLLVSTGLISYAIYDGRGIELGPFIIHAKTDAVEHDVNVVYLKEIEELKTEIEKKSAYLSPEQVIELFPVSVRKKTIELTRQSASDVHSKSLENLEGMRLLNVTASKENKTLIARLDEVKSIEGTFFYRLLIFNDDVKCYGESLNFTAGEDRPECKNKDELAERFLGFLAEVDFYSNDRKNDPRTAKEELIKLQSKHMFDTRGWYGPDVFRAIITEVHSKKA